MERWLIVMLNMIVPVLVTLLVIGIGAAIIVVLTEWVDKWLMEDDDDDSESR